MRNNLRITILVALAEILICSVIGFAQIPQTNLDKSLEFSILASNEFTDHNYDQAIKDASQAIELNPQDYTSYQIRANCWHAKEEYEKSFADNDKSIEINPAYAVAYLGRGLANQKLNRPDAAIDDYQHAWEIDPTNNAVKDFAKSMLRELDSDLIVGIINRRFAELREKVGVFAEKGKQQGDIVGSNPGSAIVCQSLKELMPFFNDYKTAQHRILFVKLLGLDAVSNLSEIIASAEISQTHAEVDQKTIEGQITANHCQQ